MPAWGWGVGAGNRVHNAAGAAGFRPSGKRKSRRKRAVFIDSCKRNGLIEVVFDVVEAGVER